MMHLGDHEVGVYYDRPSADRAVSALGNLGYNESEISVLMSDSTHRQQFSDTPQKAAQGAVTGAVIGGGLSAIIAGLTATGSIAAIAASGGTVTPLVAGPLAAALAALGGGGAAGGIIGALIGAGLSEDEAKKYEDALKRGGIVVSVRPHDNDRDRVRAALGSQAVNRANTITEGNQPVTRGNTLTDSDEGTTAVAPTIISTTNRPNTY